jgi:hypothetical protein
MPMSDSFSQQIAELQEQVFLLQSYVNLLRFALKDLGYEIETAKWEVPISNLPDDLLNKPGFHLLRAQCPLQLWKEN